MNEFAQFILYLLPLIAAVFLQKILEKRAIFGPLSTYLSSHPSIWQFSDSLLEYFSPKSKNL